MADPTLLITGATGNQGGATIDALLQRPGRWHLRALVRTPEVPKAVALAARGVELVRGDLNAAASLRAIQRHIGALGLPATIGRPAAFAETLNGLAFPTTMLFRMQTDLAADQPVQMVSVHGVGWFAADAFDA